jgi:hypothetical protein
MKTWLKFFRLIGLIAFGALIIGGFSTYFEWPQDVTFVVAVLLGVFLAAKFPIFDKKAKE